MSIKDISDRKASTIRFECGVKCAEPHKSLPPLSHCTVGGSLGMLYRTAPNLKIQFATVQTVNFFANFINAREMLACADAITLCERGLGRAVAYGPGKAYKL